MLMLPTVHIKLKVRCSAVIQALLDEAVCFKQAEIHEMTKTLN